MTWLHDGHGSSPIWVEDQVEAARNFTQAELIESLGGQQVMPKTSQVVNDNQAGAGQGGSPVHPDGLLHFVRYNDANTPIREFALPEGRTKADSWMAPYIHEPMGRVALWNDARGLSKPALMAAAHEKLELEKLAAEGKLPPYSVNANMSELREKVGY